ncbi:MAG: hypothetical protein M1818_006699 [Claussenomyces sp. TS43310]|nr:MAG: hypothetical protein M1818_006699 [Claussenomyces sp. TS43310]
MVADAALDELPRGDELADVKPVPTGALDGGVMPEPEGIEIVADEALGEIPRGDELADVKPVPTGALDGGVMPVPEGIEIVTDEALGETLATEDPTSVVLRDEELAVATEVGLVKVPLETMEEEMDEASVTGHTVVVTAIVSVTTTLSDEDRAGQVVDGPELIAEALDVTPRADVLVVAMVVPTDAVELGATPVPAGTETVLEVIALEEGPVPRGTETVLEVVALEEEPVPRGMVTVPEVGALEEAVVGDTETVLEVEAMDEDAVPDVAEVRVVDDTAATEETTVVLEAGTEETVAELDVVTVAVLVVTVAVLVVTVDAALIMDEEMDWAAVTGQMVVVTSTVSVTMIADRDG